MSYEGHEQCLCVNGHHTIEHDIWGSDKEWKCPVCQALLAWYNCVDVTNGSWDENDNRIDGHVELEIDVPAEICECKECNNRHTKTPAQYKIPESVGHKVESA